MSIRISSVDEFEMSMVSEDDELDDWEGIFEKAHLPNLKRLSKRSSFIEAKMQRNTMKKKQDRMKLRLSGLVAFVMMYVYKL